MRAGRRAMLCTGDMCVARLSTRRAIVCIAALCPRATLAVGEAEDVGGIGALSGMGLRACPTWVCPSAAMVRSCMSGSCRLLAKSELPPRAFRVRGAETTCAVLASGDGPEVVRGPPVGGVGAGGDVRS